jgi:hypothetical protein
VEDRIRTKRFAQIKCVVCAGEISQAILNVRVGVHVVNRLNLFEAIVHPKLLEERERVLFSQVKGLFNCPNEQCNTLMSRLDLSEKDIIVPIPMTEKDDQGRNLSKEAFIHYSVSTTLFDVSLDLFL